MSESTRSLGRGSPRSAACSAARDRRRAARGRRPGSKPGAKRSSAASPPRGSRDRPPKIATRRLSRHSPPGAGGADRMIMPVTAAWIKVSANAGPGPARAGPDRQLRADRRGAPAHPRQPVAVRRGVVLGPPRGPRRRRSRTPSVLDHEGPAPGGRRRERQRDPPRPRVLRRVVQRLEADPLHPRAARRASAPGPGRRPGTRSRSASARPRTTDRRVRPGSTPAAPAACSRGGAPRRCRSREPQLARGAATRCASRAAPRPAGFPAEQPPP